jgi:hypothetical protein
MMSRVITWTWGPSLSCIWCCLGWCCRGLTFSYLWWMLRCLRVLGASERVSWLVVIETSCRYSWLWYLFRRSFRLTLDPSVALTSILQELLIRIVLIGWTWSIYARYLIRWTLLVLCTLSMFDLHIVLFKERIHPRGLRIFWCSSRYCSLKLYASLWLRLSALASWLLRCLSHWRVWCQWIARYHDQGILRIKIIFRADSRIQFFFLLLRNVFRVLLSTFLIDHTLILMIYRWLLMLCVLARRAGPLGWRILRR